MIDRYSEITEILLLYQLEPAIITPLSDPIAVNLREELVG
jgi:hypothetical protein